MADDQRADSTEWLRPPVEQAGLERYVETLRERAWLIVLVTLITTAAAVAYVLTAPKTYKGEADMLITPVASTNTLLTSLGVLVDSPDPTRDIETASRLITITEVADRAKRLLHSPRSARSLLDSVSAVPVAQSNVVAISASADSPRAAADLANAFGEATVSDRTERLHRQVDAARRGIERQIHHQPRSSVAFQARLAELELLASSPDPTIRLETRANPPMQQASPRPVLSIAGGIIAGLVLGIVAAFGLQVLDPVLRREEQLRRLYQLPLLARIPKEPRRKTRRGPLSPESLLPATAEGYRTLRSTLTGRADSPRVILVTGASPSEGKTTTAVNLASSLARAGNRVILIDADLRRPMLGKALGISPKHGIVSVLIENTKLVDALVLTETHGPNLAVLPTSYQGGWISDLFAIPAAEKMINDARHMADYVVIDSPPLNEVVDSLPLARHVDAVLIVTRLGHSRLDRIAQLAEMLAVAGIQPAGFAIIGAPRLGGDHPSGYLTESAGSDGGRPRRRLVGIPGR